MKSGVLTMGEGLGIIRARDVGSLATTSEMVLGTGGAEANVAIGLARLGTAATWLGRVGDDPIGARVTRELRAEGVEVVAWIDPDASTGVIIKSTPSVARTHVMNYRSGSAGSRLSVDDLDLVDVSLYRVVHVTGITPALSSSSAAAVTELMSRARKAGALVSVDVNHRSRLWADPGEAVRSHLSLVAAADIVFAGQDEAELLVGTAADPADLAHRLNALGPDEVVITMGDRGALTLSAGVIGRCDAHPVVVVDTVGAGDAFVAGYLSELIAGEPIEQRLMATQAGALACTHPGDWEGAPTRADLAALHEDPVSR